MIKIATTVSHDNTKSHTIEGLTDAQLSALGDLLFEGQRGFSDDRRALADQLIDLIEDVEGDAAPTDLMAPSALPATL